MQLVLGIRNQIVTTIYKPENSLPPLISILLLLPLLLLLLSLLLLTDDNFGQSCWYSFFFLLSLFVLQYGISRASHCMHRTFGTLSIYFGWLLLFRLSLSLLFGVEPTLDGSILRWMIYTRVHRSRTFHGPAHQATDTRSEICRSMAQI